MFKPDPSAKGYKRQSGLIEHLVQRLPEGRFLEIDFDRRIVGRLAELLAMVVDFIARLLGQRGDRLRQAAGRRP